MPDELVPLCHCCCDCYESGDTGIAAESAVSTRNGEAQIIEEDVSMRAYNFPFAIKRSWSNRNNTAGIFGLGWYVEDIPSLDTTGMVITSGVDETLYFEEITANRYGAKYFALDILTYDSGNDEYLWTAPQGMRNRFDGNGKWLGGTSLKGHEMEVAYTGTKMDSVTVAFESGTSSGEAQGSMEFSYDGSGRITQILLKVNHTEVRKVTYEYTSGKLEHVKVEQKTDVYTSWQTIRESYYRYNAANLIQYVVGDDATKQIEAAAGGTPLTVSTTVLDQYADKKYTYFTSGTYDDWVQKVKLDGLYEYTFAYSASAHSGTDTNTWKRKAAVTRPDGSSVEYYFNGIGEVMGRVTTAGSDKWYHYQKYDAEGRMILKAASSAVASLSEGSAALITLNNSTGLVTAYSYDSNGKLSYRALKEGQNGTEIKQQEYTWAAHTVNSVSIYREATKKIYRESSIFGASDPATTSYTYTLYSGSYQIEKTVTTLPAVDTDENGSGISDTTEDHYDEYGFLTKHVDEKSVETHYEYDESTGGRTKMTEDAGAGGEQLVTDFEVDDLGRVTRIFGPTHSVDIGGTNTSIRRAQWIYYKDDVDQVWTIHGYRQGSTDVTVNPVMIKKAGQPDTTAGLLKDERIEAAYSGSNLPGYNHSFAQSSYTRWTTVHYNAGRERIKSRLYYAIPSSGAGTASNYAETAFAYDNMGRQDEVTSPEGTIRKSTFHAMGWLESEEVGTSAGNLRTVAEYEYDEGNDGGDGNFTKRTAIAGMEDSSGEANDRVIEMSYDWRNRQEEITASDGTNTFFEKLTYDNRGNVKKRERFKTNTSSSNRTRQSEEFFDALNRQYRSKVYAVNSSGVAGNALETNSYYDEVGLLARVEPGGSQRVKITQHDALGRRTLEAIACEDSAASSSASGYDPESLEGLLVLEQTKTTYDDASNVIAAVRKLRYDDATGDGELGTTGTQPKARAYHLYTYLDALGRTQAVADYGTSTTSRPATIPSSNSTRHVTLSDYDDAGELFQDTDAEGKVRRREFDDAGRPSKLIENWSADASSGDGSDTNRTRQYEYNLNSDLKKLTVVFPDAADNEETTWTYGVTVSGGSEIESKDLLQKKTFPPGTQAGREVVYEYNRQGQVIEMTDQRGVVHQYEYDRLGRMTADKATTVPGGVDGSIKRIEKGYDTRGRLASVTSYNAATGGSAVNGLLYAYNDFDQVINEYQDHSGAASGSDSGVAYAYANGSANTIRLTTTTYPDGTAVTRDYGTANGINDLIDRVEKIKDGGTVVCSYRYLGVGSFVGVKYNAASNVELSFGTSSNNYSGLDAFGRVVENKWKPSGSAVQHSTYGYDETNKRLWRDNVLTSLRDSYYTYDGVNQLENWKLGNLNAGKTGISGTPAAEQLWEFDDAGNWADYKIKASGSLTLDQGRTHNKSNQITDLDAPASVIDPTYDAAGNTTKVSKPASWTSDLDLTWDAWNRLVEVDDSGTTTTFAYDGLFRRIKKVAAGTTHHYYYNLSWQIVELRLNTSSSADRRWWWGMRNLNDLIRRQRPGSSETLYALDDAMNIVALVNSSAAVQQRMTYTPYGDVAFLSSTWGSSTNLYDWEFLYHGHYRDSQTGFYQMRYRYYHPLLGRWLNRDPIGEQSGPNLYRFVGNDGVNQLDSWGLEALEISVTNARPRYNCENDEVWFALNFTSKGLKARTSYRMTLHIDWSYTSVICGGGEAIEESDSVTQVHTLSTDEASVITTHNGVRAEDGIANSGVFVQSANTSNARYAPLGGHCTSITVKLAYKLWTWETNIPSAFVASWIRDDETVSPERHPDLATALWNYGPGTYGITGNHGRRLTGEIEGGQMLDAGEWLIIMQIICCDFEYGGWRSLPTIFSGRNRPGEAERGKGMDVLD